MSASAARQLVIELRRQGVLIESAGSSLRVDAPRGVVTAEIRSKLQDLKREVIAVLVEWERVLGLALHEFAKQNAAVQISVPWLNETLWIVPNAGLVNEITRAGVSRGRIWTAAELRDLLGIPGVSAEDFQTISRFRAAFGAEIVSIDTVDSLPASSNSLTRRVPLGRCRACQGQRFWVSSQHVTICGACHPPPTPRLVSRWIEGAER